MKRVTTVLILLVLIVTSVFASGSLIQQAVAANFRVIARAGDARITLKDAVENEITEYGSSARNLYDISASIVGTVSSDSTGKVNRSALEFLSEEGETSQNVLVSENSVFQVSFKLVQNLKVNTNEEIDLTVEASPFSTKAEGEGDSSTDSPELINCSPQLLAGRTVSYDNVHKFTIKYEYGQPVGENIITYFDLCWPTNPNLRDGTYESSVSLTYVIK